MMPRVVRFNPSRGLTPREQKLLSTIRLLDGDPVQERVFAACEKHVAFYLHLLQAAARSGRSRRSAQKPVRNIGKPIITIDGDDRPGA